MKLKDFEVRALPLQLSPALALALSPRGLSICPVRHVLVAGVQLFSV